MIGRSTPALLIGIQYSKILHVVYDAHAHIFNLTDSYRPQWKNDIVACFLSTAKSLILATQYILGVRYFSVDIHWHV